MDFSSFLTSLGTSFIIFVILMLLFSWLSRKPGNEFIYYPNRIVKGLDPYTRTTRNPVSWIKEAVTSTEDDIISLSGVDSAAYFVFLSTALTMLVCSGIVLLPTLLPVAVTDHSVHSTNTTSNGTFSELDKYSMGHIEESSPRLWAFLGALYWVSLVTYFLLWKAYKHVTEIRATALMSSEVKAEQFAVLVRDIPTPKNGETRKEQVDSYFREIYPDTFYKSLIVTDNKKVKSQFVEVPICYPHPSCPTSEKEKSMHHFINSRSNTYYYQLVLVVNLLWVYEWTISSLPCLGCPDSFSKFYHSLNSLLS